MRKIAHRLLKTRANPTVPKLALRKIALAQKAETRGATL
jgi:hypothetical protein